MKALEPKRQQVWRMPAVLNFTLGGLGAGLYVIGSITSLFVSLEPSLIYFYKTASLLFLLFGIYFVALEAGRAFRARFLIKNIRKSWMSRESLGIYLFLFIIILDLIFENSLIKITGIVIANFILLSHGMILYNSKGIPAWNTKIIVSLFMISGLASGSALLLFISALYRSYDYILLNFTLLLLVGSMVLWLIYLYYIKDSEFRFSTRILRSAKFLMLIVLIGHLIPVIGIIGYVSLVDIFNPNLTSVIFLIVLTILIISSSFLMKYGVIVSSGYFRRIILHKK